jgi:hypothetical protein
LAQVLVWMAFELTVGGSRTFYVLVVGRSLVNVFADYGIAVVHDDLEN